jgi:hypothetical protein
MENFQAIAKSRDKAFHINPNQVCMSSIKAKAQNLRMILFIKSIYPLRRFPCITAWTLNDMPGNIRIKVLNTYCDLKFFRHWSQCI